MKTPQEKKHTNKGAIEDRSISNIKGSGTFQFKDNRPEALVQRKLKPIVEGHYEVIQTKAIRPIVRLPIQLKQNEVLQLMRIVNPLTKEEKDHADGSPIPDGWEKLAPAEEEKKEAAPVAAAAALAGGGYNTNVRMGRRGKDKHIKQKATDATQDGEVTKRQEKTLDRHIARIQAGKAKVIGRESGGAGDITIVSLPSTKKGKQDHIYGIKQPDGKTGESGIHPRPPEAGGNYDSGSDED